VLDLVSKLKLSDQRHRDSPNTREDHTDGHYSWQQQALVRGWHVAARHHHSPENKHEHHRLQEGLQQEWNKVASRDVSITREQGNESFPVHSRKLRPVWCRNKFSRLGSEMCTSDNSTDAAAARLAISETSEPPRSAYTSVPFS